MQYLTGSGSSSDYCCCCFDLGSLDGILHSIVLYKQVDVANSDLEDVDRFDKTIFRLDTYLSETTLSVS